MVILPTENPEKRSILSSIVTHYQYQRSDINRLQTSPINSVSGKSSDPQDQKMEEEKRIAKEKTEEINKNNLLLKALKNSFETESQTIETTNNEQLDIFKR